MTEKLCSKCKSIEAAEHFEKEGGAEHFEACLVCRKLRQRHYHKHKDDLNRKSREE